MRRVLLAFALIAAGCGSSSPPPAEPGAPPSSAPAPASSVVPDPKVSTELRRSHGGRVSCGEGDVCGYFLQIISPGSDPKDLADKAVRIIKGKCGGHVVVYKDPRNVTGAGTVFTTPEEKRACEKALGRPDDKDFPHYVVLRVMK
jgi:hypothetical protein